MISASVLTTPGPDGRFSAEALTGVGIDFNVQASAPSHELVCLDYGANDDKALGFHGALSCLGLLYGLVERQGQRVSILHDFENSRIVLADKPGDADADSHGVALRENQKISRGVA